MKQVVVIHGGMTFKTYKEYIHSLKSKKVSIDTFQSHKTWRHSIEEQLGKNFQLLVPRMPNSNNSVYQEWKIWFEKMSSFIKHDVILVGHSLGGIFLAKYLAENKFKKRIKALLLVAAPYDDCTKESLGKFILPKDLHGLSNQCKDIYLVFSKDDPVVPIREIKKYKDALPDAQMIIFKSRGHFSQDHFPELAKLIKNL